MHTSAEVGTSSVPEFKVYLVLPQTVFKMESEIRYFLDLDERENLNDYPTDEVIEDLKDGETQCWGIVDSDKVIAIAITQILEFGNNLELFVASLAGSRFEEFKETLDASLTAFAKSEQCVAIRSMSRRGMVKALKPLGFKEEVVMMRKVLASDTKLH